MLTRSDAPPFPWVGVPSATVPSDLVSEGPDPGAFSASAPGTFGNLENNSLVGPHRVNVDMGLTRSFRLAGAHQVRFRAEVFNVFNRVQLNTPVSALNRPNFGLITSAADPRIIQLTLKYTF